MSKEKLAELEKFHRTLRDKRQADRVKAVIALSKGWSAAQEIELKDYLVEGQNVVAIEAIKDGRGSAAAADRFVVQLANEDRITIVVDDSWKTSKQKVGGWERADFDGSDWLWSAERIKDTLILLQYDPPCEDTIRKYMYKTQKPRERSTTWLPFLRNHLDVSWAIDFFTVTTINFAAYYVFLVFDHGRRRVIHFAVTRNPFMNWVIQQLRETMPFGLQPKYLFRDNDGIYGNGVRAFLDSCGIEEVRTAYRSPWQNPFVERFIGTLRREMLDHVIVLSQSHLERLLREFIEDYYHVARPHQGLDGDTPVSQTKQPEISGPSKLISIPVLGGLHHRYVRVAA